MNRRHHPVWNDLQGPAVLGVGGAALTTVNVRDTEAQIQAMSSTGTDRVTFWPQMPHGWDGKSAVRPHLHYKILSTPAADRVVYLRGRYAWESNGDATPAWASWTPWEIQIPVLTTDTYKHLIVSLFEAEPPAGAGPSSFLVVTVTRDGASATDTYTDGGPSNFGLMNMDTHVLTSRHGSLDEFGDSLA